MPRTQIIEAELTLTGDRLERNVQVVVDARGHIGHIDALGEKPTLRLERCALLPGFVNAHSHAFQRGLRGLGESFPEGAGSFWTWREAMYALVERMSADEIYRLSRQAFVEMRRCGITTVGEFHYLHHDDTNSGYAFDDIVLTAARDAGIRLCLLNAFYNTGGIGKPLAGGQSRFGSTSRDEYWAQMDRLRDRVDSDLQSIGAVVHSIRAASLEDMIELRFEASRRGIVFHMHLEEQPAEIEECMRAYSRTPMRVVLDELKPDQSLTAVHCTHTRPEEMQLYCAAGANVCLCPLTEGNLGDGIPDVPGILRSGGHICLGSDSNARINMVEEMRWLEYVQRLATQSRGVCRDGRGEIASSLLQMATRNGARSLGINAGRITPGCWADFTAIDLEHPSLAGCEGDTLLPAIIHGTSESAIAATCVGGQWEHYERSPHLPG